MLFWAPLIPATRWSCSQQSLLSAVGLTAVPPSSWNTDRRVPQCCFLMWILSLYLFDDGSYSLTYLITLHDKDLIFTKKNCIIYQNFLQLPVKYPQLPANLIGCFGTLIIMTYEGCPDKDHIGVQSLLI